MIEKSYAKLSEVDLQQNKIINKKEKKSHFQSF